MKRIGRGTFGTLMQARAGSGHLVAVKVANYHVQRCCLKCPNLDCECSVAEENLLDEAASGSSGVAHEINVLKRLEHPNIIPLLGDGMHTTFVAGRTVRRPFFVMPQALRPTVCVPKCLRPFVRTFVTQVASALHYMHKTACYAHLDLSNGNILNMSGPPDPVFVLCDFGAARPIDSATGFGDHAKSADAKKCRTTHLYAAPEVFSTKKDLTVNMIKADIWSLGMVILGFCGWFHDEKGSLNSHVWQRARLDDDKFERFNNYTSDGKVPIVDKYINDLKISQIVCEHMLRATPSNRADAESIYGRVTSL